MYDQNTTFMEDVQQKKQPKSVQDIVGDNLFPHVAHISDVKQVVEEMTGKSQNLQQPQMRAIMLLMDMQNNEYLHGDRQPYQQYIDKLIKDFKPAAAEPNFYLNLINELIPKPPKPIVVLPNGKAVQEVRK
ncbi:hypothetical protein [Lysinibacillus sp. 54212]|uniref:hypothetical protein n=1 Tax=Lysinibacillus sp. 54212 TaxID=3119829 RepID=UPI002FC745E0